MVIEDGFVNPFQDDSHHLLDQFIIPRRDTQWALLAIFLRDIGPANRLKTIGSAFESRDDGRDPFFREPIQRDLIYANTPLIGFPCFEMVSSASNRLITVADSISTSSLSGNLKLS